MDKYGQGVGFQFSDITANKDIDFNNFSRQMILEMCIMSGCDYLPSLPGMGVKKAHGLMKRFKTYIKVILLTFLRCIFLRMIARLHVQLSYIPTFSLGAWHFIIK